MKLGLSIKRFFLLLIILLSGLSSLKAQMIQADSLMIKVEQFGNYLLYKNHDTTFIKNYSEDFILRIVAVNKFNYFKISDKNRNSSIRYRPDRRVNLGFGVSYKWFALDIVFNVGLTEDSNFENSKFFDFQANIFSSKQFVSGYIKYYYGYQIINFTGITTPDIQFSPNRGDVRTINLGMNYLFALNYDQFSLKAPFIQNEIQLKSAGSFLLGAGFNLYIVDSDSSIIPSVVQDDFDEKLYFRNLSSLSAYVNFGYMYTYIWKKHFFVTLGLIPGFGINMGDFQTEFRKPFDTHLYFGLNSKSSIGYNAKKIFMGINLLGDIYSIRIDKKLATQVGHGKLKFFVGYRFGRS